VTVVGELNLDLILYGLPQELEPDRELLADSLTLTLGSSSAIFAHNLAVLGSRVGFASRIGQDALGRIALERLAAGGVDVSRVRRTGGPTTTGLTVILPHGGSRNILTYPGTMFEMSFEDLDLEFLASGKHFHLSSYFLHRALRPRIPELFQRMKAAGLTTSFDTNDDPEDRWERDVLEVLRHVDVFMPNEREIKKLAGDDDLEGAVDRLAAKVPILVIKLGPRGALVRRGAESITVPPVPVELVDPVGAGDSFDAGFINKFVSGSDLASCARWGNLAGAFSVTRPGGTEAFHDRDHFKRFFAKHASEM
jgi:sugar/nucleoside kinase (ribokinase family)